MKTSTKILNVIGAGVSTLTAEFDTQGFNYAKIYVCGSTSVAPATNNNNIVETDTSGGTTNAISTLVQGTTYTLSTATNNTSVAKIVYGVPLGGRKRYLRATYTSGSVATLNAAIICELSDAGDTILTRRAGTAATDAAGSVVNL
jgi:hypothetical protein